MLRDLARALSLANLCFIAVWATLIDPLYNIPGFNQYLSIIINVLLLALLFWTAITVARRLRKPLALRIARLVFPLILLIPLNGVMRMLFPYRWLAIDLTLTALAIAMISLSDVRPWDYAMLRSAATVTLVLFPFFLITMGQLVWSLTKFTDRVPAAPVGLQKTSAARVLWLLFDEMDYQIAFSRRPAMLQLPELDRFRSQAIFASNAYPPADYTMASMPALVTGRRVSKAKLVNPSKLMIAFADSEERVSWGSQPNVFSEARGAGLNTAAIGWYIPYCRMIGENLTSCSSQDFEGLSLLKTSLNQIEGLINTIPLGSILAPQIGVIRDERARLRQERQNHLKAFFGVWDGAKKAAVDPSLNLILAHWPVPHGPGIYNRGTDDFELDSDSSYIDNFPLVDRVLRELRRAMEDAGTWDETTVLVTADHWWRYDIWRYTNSWTSEDQKMLPVEVNHRVPFILKLRGQNKGVTYDAEFNTVLTHDLILALLRGELTSAESVVNWLDRRRSLQGSPYRISGSE